jgi:hypothetical protein
MPVSLISPGVGFTEIDQSFRAQDVVAIGASVIGTAPKGPAFVPTVCVGKDGYVSSFGGRDPKHFGSYLMLNYLTFKEAALFTRVLGHADGTGVVNGYQVGSITAIADDSGSTGNILAVVHHTGSHSSLICSQVSGDDNNFVVKVALGATTLFAATASFLTSSANYVEKVMNTDPTKYSTYGHYLYQVFKYKKPKTGMQASGVGVSGSLTSFQRDFTAGSTPWVISQDVGGTVFDLLKFHTLPHGRATNDQFKVTLANVRPSPNVTATPYGTFDVLIRDFYDTDQRPVILESFVGCTLDPRSNAFIARKIGDYNEYFDTATRKIKADGEYRNKSKYVRVEMNLSADYPPESLPWGFRGYERLAFVSSSTFHGMPYTPNQYDRNGNVDPNVAWGVLFVSGGIVDRMRAHPNSATGGLTGSDSDFSLKYLSASWNSAGKQVWTYNTSLAQASWHGPVYTSASLYKFTMPFFGGFDGLDLRVANPFHPYTLTNSADDTDISVVSLKRALDVISNRDIFLMDLLFVPGVHNLKVTDHARTLVNDRKDAFYVMDVTGATVTEVVENLRNRELDDNYTGCYYPDLKLDDRDNNRIVRVPPSVAVAGAMAYSDKVAHPWFAPAGFNRGGVSMFGITDLVDRLDQDDRDLLYANRINPITNFAGEGIVIFGQKTLQVKESALDRINVRRLLIDAKKQVERVARTLVFEQNDATTWQNFANGVNPILEQIRQNRGLDRFLVISDSTVNTPDVVDRNILKGKIFLQPTRAVEFVDVDFIITPSGVTFGS